MKQVARNLTNPFDGFLLGNRLISPAEDAGPPGGEIVCRERLGGLLRYYYRRAA